MDGGLHARSGNPRRGQRRAGTSLDRSIESRTQGRRGMTKGPDVVSAGPGGGRIVALVPVWNGEKLLERCVDALLRTTSATSRQSVDVVLVDDGSTDASADVARGIVRSCGGRVRLVEVGANFGFAGAVNRGVHGVTFALSSGVRPEFLVLVNQDCIVSEGWLEPLVAAFEDPRVAIAGARLLDADGVTLQHAGARIEANGLTTHIGRGSRDPHAWRDNLDVDYVCGALVAMRTQTWMRHGPFDEGYAPAYFEEVDLCTKIRRAGMRVVYVAASEARHLEASTSGVGSAEFLRRYHRSRMRFVARHLLVRGRRMRWLASELSWLLRLRQWNEIAPVLAAYRRLPGLLLERSRATAAQAALEADRAFAPVEIRQ
jgi:GT2 family glycosyltransferase